MSHPPRAGVQAGRRVRADVRQALLKSSSAHLYPGIPPGEWQPASVMVQLVRALKSANGRAPSARDRILDDDHFEFRGRLSAGGQDDQRRTRLEERHDRKEGIADS
jgi:hypothetical protein